MSVEILERRRTFISSRRRNHDRSLAVLRRVLQASLLLVVFAWAIAAVHFLARNDHVHNNLRETESHGHVSSTSPIPIGHVPDLENDHTVMVALELEINDLTTLTIRIAVTPSECPKAYEFITWMIENQRTECHPCTIYRGEPVPAYWGSTAYPDRWDRGGRWGPPYALVQGGFPNHRIAHVEREAHRPVIERGMVAWAGPQGVHFFIALAHHPEWGHEHTVWGQVLEEDMALVDALVDGSRPLKVLQNNEPVVTNFVNPMPFLIRRDS